LAVAGARCPIGLAGSVYPWFFLQIASPQLEISVSDTPRLLFVDLKVPHGAVTAVPPFHLLNQSFGPFALGFYCVEYL